MKRVIVSVVLAMVCVGARAQQNTPNQTFGTSVMNYFTAVDTNSTTFTAPVSFSVGVDSIQNGPVALANSLRVEYSVYHFAPATC